MRTLELWAGASGFAFKEWKGNFYPEKIQPEAMLAWYAERLFRHDSWFDDDVYALLRGAGASLCLSEREDSALPPLVETAPWGYVRLRLENYSDADLAAWAERLAATQWQAVYAYFMHDPTAPGYAAALLAKFRAS